MGDLCFEIRWEVDNRDGAEGAFLDFVNMLPLLLSIDDRPKA
jgi:hypothetical protein